MIQFLSKKIAYAIAEEECATQALKAAEQKIKYIKAQR